MSDPKTANRDTDLFRGSYWLTRIILLRFISFIYLVAFAVALNQNKGLLGKEGLLPADQYLRAIDRHVKGDLREKLSYAPTLLWFAPTGYDIDLCMDILATFGICISILVIILGSANMILMATLWILYHSIVAVGQRWYSFGWESQLLESGFLAIFLCPLVSLRRVPPGCPTPLVAILGYRWLIIRIMFGAGLIKMRGDRCWWPDLSCMDYHYETQPVPNPIAWYLHKSPTTVHKIEVLGNHFVELVAPFLLFVPGALCAIGGFIQILFQVILIISGNLSFLNWLTILPSLACIDDSYWRYLFSRSGSTCTEIFTLKSPSTSPSAGSRQSWGYYVRKISDFFLAVLIGYLSIPVVRNLFSSHQAMNTSFDPLRIVNTYGAFGSVTKDRTEVIFQGTSFDDPENESAVWLEYEFKCKPGNVSRRPCLISPYHYRLDWLMWFAAFQNYQHNPWLVHLAAKLLNNDPVTSDLIEFNPFLTSGDPPKWIRAEHYRYKYSKFGSKDWWTRRKIGSYLPPVSLDALADYLNQMGWPKIARPRWKKKRF